MLSKRLLGVQCPPKKRRLEPIETPVESLQSPETQEAIPLRWSPPPQRVDPISAFRDYKAHLERVKQKLAERWPLLRRTLLLKLVRVKVCCLH